MPFSEALERRVRRILELPDDETGVFVVLALAMLAGLSWAVFGIPDAPGPSYDDREAVVGNPVVEGTLPASAAFGRDYWHHLEDAGHYRPLATLLLRWDRWRAEREDGTLDWSVFRETNAGLHALIVLLLGLALVRLDREHGLPLPWLGLGLFAVHPALADVVAWISGRTSLVSGLGAAVGVLIATLVTRKRDPRRAAWLALASGFAGTGLALLGKEDGVVLVVAIPIVCWWCGGGRAATLGAVGAVAAVAVVAAMRSLALGSAIPSSPSAPLADAGLVERVTIGLAAWWEGFASIVAPLVSRPPSLDVADVTSPPGAGVRALLLVAIGALCAIGLIAVARRGKDERHRTGAAAGAVGLVLIAACIAPLAQIVPAGEIFAPRFLYQPLLLGVFATTAVWDLVALPLRGTAVSPALKVTAILGCAALVRPAAAVYESRASYWRAHLPHHAEDARVWNALGNASREEGDLGAARDHFLRSAELDPEYSRPRTNLGTMAIQRGDLEAAERWLREAVALGPNNPAAHANLGNVLLRLDRPDEAVAPYRRAVELAPGRASLHRGLARALFESGDAAAAEGAALRAVELDPADESARTLLSRIERALGR